MSGKTSIIHNLRNQLRTKHSLNERQANVAEHIAAKGRGVLPKFPNTKVGLIKKFMMHAEAADATVVRVDSNTINNEIPMFLRRHNLPMRVKYGDDPRLAALTKKSSKLVEYSSGVSDGSDLVCLSYAECGIAETGTLGLISDKANPTTNNFLPENHIVIVNQNDLVRHYEDLWDLIRKKLGENHMPRTVNLVTGPSRSGDIEQKLILGAHGPMRLHILLLA